MATVKVKFRASSIPNREGALYYQVIQNRIARQIHTGYKVYPAEWNVECSEISFPADMDENRRDYLISLKEVLGEDLVRLKKIINHLEGSCRDYSAEKVVELFCAPVDVF